MLYQHLPNEPLGVWETIREDARGLYVRGRLVLDVQRAREVRSLIADGALNGLSIGFRTVRARRDAKAGLRVPDGNRSLGNFGRDVPAAHRQRGDGDWGEERGRRRASRKQHALSNQTCHSRPSERSERGEGNPTSAREKPGPFPRGAARRSPGMTAALQQEKKEWNWKPRLSIPRRTTAKSRRRSTNSCAAFDAFKGANDERLAALEKRSADVVTDEKVDRINRALDEQKRALDELTLAAAASRHRAASAKPCPIRCASARPAFDRYVRKGDAGGLDALEVKALSAGSNPDGGYTVPLEIESTIDRVLAKASPVRSIATVRQIGANVYRKPINIVEAASGWVGETGAVSQTGTPTLAAIDFPAMELYAMPAATQTLLDDSQVDIEQWLADEVQIVFAEQEGAAFVNGDGSNKPTGFLHYTAVADGSWSWGNLGYIASGADGAFAVVQSRRCAAHARLCAEAGLSRQRPAG